MAEVNVDIKVVANQALASLKKIESQGEKTSKGFSNLGKSVVTLNQGFALIGKGFNAIKGAFNSVVAAASVQEDAIKELEFALASSGSTSAKASQDFQKFASELQEVTTFGDEVTLSAAALFTQLTKMTGEGLKKATIAAQNMSAALNIDLNTAMRMIAKASEDGGSGLRRYNVSVEKGSTKAENLANAIESVNAQFAGVAKSKIETYSGATKQLSNTFGDLLEEIGFAITKNPLIIAAVKAATQAITNGIANIKIVIASIGDTYNSFTNYVIKNQGALKTAAIAMGIAATAFGVYAIAVNSAAIATGIATAATTAFTAVMAILTSPITLVIASIATLGAGVFLLAKNWDLVSAKTKEYAANVIDFILPAVDAALNAFGALASIFSNDLAASIEKQKQNLRNLSSSLREESQKQLKEIKDSKAKEVQAEKEAEEKKAEIRAISEEKKKALLIESAQSNTNAKNEEAQKEIDILKLRDEAKLIQKQENAEIEKELEIAKNDEDLQRLIDTLGEKEVAKTLHDARLLEQDGKTKEALAKLNALQLKNDNALIAQQKKIQGQRTANTEFTINKIATLSDSGNKVLSSIGKAAAIRNATIDGYAAVQKALASGIPFPANLAAAALVGGIAAANVAKIAGVKGFQDGGIVGGNSFTGDRVPALVNSGELILNKSQQDTIAPQLQGGNITINIESGVVENNDSLIDKIVEGINRGTEFRNLRLQGAA